MGASLTPKSRNAGETPKQKSTRNFRSASLITYQSIQAADPPITESSLMHAKQAIVDPGGLAHGSAAPLKSALIMGLRGDGEQPVFGVAGR